LFAFALWSAREEKLLLARDPLGMKPLYYSSLPGNQGFVFASEIKAFFGHPDIDIEVEPEAVPYYFIHGDGDAARSHLGGVLATICPADKKIIHGMKDAILAPCCVNK
jgi:asparagine synthase (glutamine-hydrolysing)